MIPRCNIYMVGEITIDTQDLTVYSAAIGTCKEGYDMLKFFKPITLYKMFFNLQL
jgi:hypothetical protein